MPETGQAHSSEIRPGELYGWCLMKGQSISSKQNLSRAGIPRGVWWFIALLALVMLCLIAIFVEREPIGSDLERRVMAQLAVEKIDWISVELDGHDGVVLLTGNAPSAESRDLAIEIVESVHGVRVVYNQVEIKSSLASSELSIEQQDGRVLLGGRLASQASIDAVVNAAKKTYGNDNVTNDLIVSGEVKTAKWLDASAGLLPTLAGMKTAQLKISDSESLLTAEVSSHGERLILVRQARKLLGKNLDAKVAVFESQESGIAQGKAAKPEVTATPEDPAIKACQSNLDREMKDRKILFASNSAELKEASFPLLDRIISVLERCDKAFSENRLTIAGHTDSLGDDRYNQALSQRRADAVKTYIVNAVTDVGAISSVGYGESQPIESNDTDKGRARNRRIELKLDPR